MRPNYKNIETLYLFTLFAGTLFFIPAIFVDRFTTVPSLWMQVWISTGILGYVLSRKGRAAILATVVIFILFFIRLLKERDIRFSFVHYTVVALCCLLLLAGLFFIKKDSASGRLLIWQCSAQLVSRKPVFGYGGNGFTTNYMDEQASYFTKHPDSKYAMLADNVRHPFNEFLKWTINYGMAGLSLTLLLVVKG
ncbi:O-antigen ligase family protein [Proteiniphilum acetatigenes]|uniref:O-antigen ligase family protein n=1 Tax=Proteiniphilum acetatigenes TaxID=294710 RepID=UPI000477F3CE|nr:O-antigen ligase family protein [Proteiniphilum acetatigenes]